MIGLDYDGVGLVGALLHYALILFFCLSAFFLFLFFWYRGRLDMDEEPKWKMLENDLDEGV